MDNVPRVEPISASTPSVTEAMLTVLQAQASAFAQSAVGQIAQASPDYKALQTAIRSGNIIEAEAALARLHQGMKATTPAAGPPAGGPAANAAAGQSINSSAAASQPSASFDTVA